MKESYITTAIPYVNGKPHLGHAMDYLLADTLRRYMMYCGKEVRLQAGTDEHGNKIFKKAAEQGIPTQEFVDQTMNAVVRQFGPSFPTIFTRTNMKAGIAKVVRAMLPIKNTTRIMVNVRTIKNLTLN